MFMYAWHKLNSIALLNGVMLVASCLALPFKYYLSSRAKGIARAGWNVSMSSAISACRHKLLTFAFLIKCIFYKMKKRTERNSFAKAVQQEVKDVQR